MKNKIEKRLVKINGFLKSDREPTHETIHQLRVDVKHLEAFLELMTIQNNFSARPGIPDRLGKLFNEAGKLRKLGLEISAIRSISNNYSLSKPTLFLEHLKSSEKKTSKKLCNTCRPFPAFKPNDFAKHPDSRLSSITWKRFLTTCASTMLDLLAQDIISDIRSLHHMRKILKSILYVLPLCKKDSEQVRVFLNTRIKLIKSVESKIGSLHDTDFFINWLEKKHNIEHGPEQDTLKRIKQEWQSDMVRTTKELQPLIPVIRQFALDLKDQSTVDLNTVIPVSV